CYCCLGHLLLDSLFRGLRNASLLGPHALLAQFRRSLRVSPVLPKTSFLLLPNLAGAEGFEPPSPVLETGSLAVELTPLYSKGFATLRCSSPHALLAHFGARSAFHPVF